MRDQVKQWWSGRRFGAGALLAPLCVVALLGAALSTSARAPWTAPPELVASPGEQLHYLPFDADQFLTTLRGQRNASTNIDNPVRLITSIVSARAANTVVIDHWEDGFDVDPVNSPGATTETSTMAAGQVQVLDNFVDVTKIGQIDPNGTGQPYYDGRDKIISTAPVVVTAGGWPTTAGTLHAGSSAVPEVSRYGYDFVSPVGEDAPFPAGTPTASPWEYTGLIVAASQDNTTVTVAGGAPLTLDEGQTALVNGGINFGDAVHADKPVAVYLSTGDKGATYEGRMFELTPTERWSDEYFSPVTSTNDTNEVTRVFLYNPGAGPISVGYTQSDGATGTIAVAAGGQANFKVPTDLGVKFSSPGNPFYALQAITTPEPGNDSSSAYNWGFSLIPGRFLTPMVVVGYGAGSDGFTENDNAVWVSPEADTTIYVDRDGDAATGANTDVNGNKYDFSCAVTALSPRLLKDDGSSTCYVASAYTNTKDTGDADMTGARIYTLDGTSLAAAWGQVPGLNSGAPAIDMGTTILPFPTIDLTKTSDIVNDDGDGLADPGETIRYTITANNTGIAPADTLVLTDGVPANTTYTLATTQTNGNPIADDGAGTPFPLDGSGVTLPPALAVGETRTVTFDVVVDRPLAPGVTQIVNEATLATSYGTYVAVDVQPTAPPEPSVAIAKTVYRGHDAGASCQGPDTVFGQNGDAVTYCFAVTNDGATDLAPVTIADADLGIDETDMTAVSGDLTSIAPGDTRVLYYETTISGDLTNTATVTGVPVDGNGDPIPATDPVTARDTAQVDQVAPAVSVAKTVYRGHDSGALCAGAETATGVNGDAVTYCFTVTNDGDTTLAPVTVADADLGIDQTAMTSLSGDLALLAPGASATLYFESTIDGDLTNTASVSGTPADANGVALPGLGAVTGDDTASVDEVAPAVSVAKTVYRGHDAGTTCAGTESVAGLNGDAVTYCFVVTNDGDTPLAPVTVTDGDLGITDADMSVVSGDLSSLAPGASATLYFESVLDGDLTNTASVSGVPVDGSGAPLPGVAPVTGDDTASVNAVGPAALVAKTVYRGHDAGASCEGTQTVVGRNGDDITYCFVVTNNGDVPLSPVTVTDPDLGIDETDMTVLSGDLATVAPGDSVALYFESTIDGDLVNHTSVSGPPVDDNGDPLPGVDPVGDDDTAQVDEVAPAVSVAKTVYRGHDAGAGCTGGELVQARNGADVTYCFEVTNDGDTALSPVTIADADLAITEADMSVLSGDLSSLAPGGSATLYFESTVDGDLTNTATVTGTPVDGGGTPLAGVDPVTGDDTAQVDEVGPAVSVAKTVYAGHDAGASCAGAELVTGANGADLTYCFGVTNTGDTALSPVTLADADLGITEADMVVLSGDLSSLAPGDTATLSYETALDGDLTNTATATGAPVDGNGDPIPGIQPVTADDTAQVDEVTPSVVVSKTVYRGHDAGAGCEGSDLVSGVNGDGVTYCFVVTNNGGATLAPVTVTDASLGIDQTDMTAVSGDLASLAPGDSATLYFEATITGDLVNTASATGTPLDPNGDPLPGGQPVGHDDTAQVDQVAPAVSVAKTVYRGHDAGASCAGGELVRSGNGTAVTYCFVVTNDGDTTLSPVTVADVDLGITEADMTVLSGDLASLAPGDSVSLYFESSIDGDLTNTAVATGTPVDGNGDPYPGLDPVTGDDTAQVDEVAPALSVAKTVYRGHDSGAGCPGGELVQGRNGAAVTYCFVVTNDGDTTLAPVTVADADLGITEADMTVLSGDLASLAPGDSATLYFEATVDGDLTNTAAVTGTPVDGNGDPIPGADPVTNDDTAAVDDVSPAVSLAKTVYRGHDAGAGCAGSNLLSGLNGEAVTYCFVVTNSGESALTPVTVADADLGITEADMTVLSGDLASLAPGDSATLYFESSIDGDLTNTATATGTPVDGNGDPLPGSQPVTDDDSAQVDEVAPAVSVAKTVYRGHDSGAGCAGSNLVSGLNGDAVTYCFVVTNDGDTTLTPVTVADADLGITEADMTVLSGDLASLAPGDSASLYFESSIDGDLTNTAAVTGTPVDGNGDPLDGVDPVTHEDTAQVDQVGPSVSVAKSVYRGHDSGAGCAGSNLVSGLNGDAVTYCFDVTNNGDTTLAPVTVADADLGITEADMTVLSGDLASLAPGDSATLYFESSIDGDLTNTAAVSGVPVDGNGDPLPGVDPVTNEDTAQVDEVAPAASVAKTVYRGHDSGAGCAGSELVSGLNGDAVTYCFVITNEGDTTLAPVTVADADLGITEADMTVLSGDLASLAPGDSATLYIESSIDGDLTNTAAVTGTPVDGNGDPLDGVDPVTNEDTAQVDEVAPAVSVAKTVYRGHDAGAGCAGSELVSGRNGTEITYCFVVTNDGDTTLSPVTVADADLGITEADMTVLSGDLASLAPGDSATLFFESAIDGDLTNTAVATGTPVDGNGDPLAGVADVTDRDTAAVDAVGPSVSVAKTVYRGHDSGAGCAGSNLVSGLNGDAVTYCFVVTNDGDVPLAPVTAADADLGITEADMTVLSGDLSSLAPGDSATLFFDATIDGDLMNTAAVSGVPVDGNGDPLPGVDPVTNEDTAQVDEVAPAVSVAKTVYRGHDAGAGCTGSNLVSGLNGDAVTYCFVVTNGGDTTLSPVTVADVDLGITEADLSVLSGDLASLAPGDSATLYFESAIDGDLTNTAAVTGTPVDGNGDPLPGVDPVTHEDTAQVDEVAPAVSVAKTVYRGHDAGAGCAGSELVSGLNGDAVTYCFTVTNDGDATLSPVTVVDADLGIDEADMTVLSGDLASLAPGDSASLYFESAIDGDLTNTAAVTGTPVDGNGDPLPGVDPVTNDDTADVDEVAPAVSVAKTVYRGHDAGAGCDGAELLSGLNGEAITYCFEVTNTGDTTLAPVTVADADLGITEADMTVLSGDLASLAPGDSATLYFEATIDGDLTNTAAVTGTPVDGNGDPLAGVDPVTNDDTAQVDEVAPAVSIAKTVYRGHDSGAGCAGSNLVSGLNGDAVTYCFDVTNDGDTTLAPVTVADADLGITEADMTVLSGDLASLAPGDSATLYFETALDGDLTNTAAVSGVPVDDAGVALPGVDPVTDENTAAVDAVGPAVMVAKTVYRGHDDGAGCAGDELVHGVNGDAVTYCFEVTNNGDTTLSPVTVVDDDLGIDDADMTTLSGDLSSLAAGDSATLYFEATVDGDLTNTAVATGTPVDGAGDPLDGVDPVSDDDTAQVDEVAPAVSVAKTVYRGHDDGAGCAGDESVTGVHDGDVTYCFEVTNDGDTTLAPVEVVDADLGIDETDMVVLSGDLSSLAPGDTVSLYFETVIDGDLTNTATVTGTPVDDAGVPLDGVDPVTGDDTAEVDEVAPAMTILTEVLDPFTGDWFDADSDDATLGSNDGIAATFGSGDTASFRFTVTNTGDAPITDVVVDAPQCDNAPELVSGDTVNPGVLDVDEVWVLTCDVSDVTAGMTMTATVTGDAGGDVPEGSGTSETAAIQVAAISVDKTVEDPETDEFVDSATLESGADATFRIVVTNTGEVPLSGVTVSDASAPDCDQTFTDTLAPGESFVAYTCVVAGVDEGFVNTATVTGTPVDGQDQPVGDDVTDDGTATVNVTAPPVTDLAITKDLVDIDQTAGIATWQIDVTNVGDLAATEPIRVTDDLPAELGYRNAGGENWSCEFVDPTVTCVTDLDLAPGDTTSITVETYVLSDPGQTVTNVANVDGTDDTDATNNTDHADVDTNNQGQPVPAIPGTLPRTGADVAGLLAAAGLLIATGAAFRRSARRRMAG